jgi:CheY-like chemotaxis protein
MPKVMVVEDNRMNSRLLSFVLERDGFTVSVYENAEEAIEHAVAEPPDIILMDIQLPGMDGLEAARRLKEEAATAAVPIVAITAHAMTGDEERILAAGCAGYISKPINTRELSGAVRGFLG